jgi:hypothetical protein
VDVSSQSPHKAESTAVLKARVVSSSTKQQQAAAIDKDKQEGEDEDHLESQQRELQRIKEALKDQSHVANRTLVLLETPGNTRKPHLTVRPFALLLRPHVYTTPRIVAFVPGCITWKSYGSRRRFSKRSACTGGSCTRLAYREYCLPVVAVGYWQLQHKRQFVDDDPSEYLATFNRKISTRLNRPRVAAQRMHHKSVAYEKRCYSAPERFIPPRQKESNHACG